MNPLRFLPIAAAVAKMSKDPRTKVGAVVVSDDGTILSVGYNGFPRGVNDDPLRYADREVKLRLISHAESNAIAQAARHGVRLEGASLIVTALYPCSSCAKQIIQSGIKRVLTPAVHSAVAHADWAREAEVSQLLFTEAGVNVVLYEEPATA